MEYIGIYIKTVTSFYINYTRTFNTKLSVVKSFEFKNDVMNELLPIINKLLVNVYINKITSPNESVTIGLYISHNNYTESILLDENIFFTNLISYSTLFKIQADYMLRLYAIPAYYKKLYINTKLLRNTFNFDQLYKICDEIDSFNICKTRKQIKKKLIESDPNIKIKWYNKSSYLKKLIFERLVNEVIKYSKTSLQIIKQNTYQTPIRFTKKILETDV